MVWKNILFESAWKLLKGHLRTWTLFCYLLIETKQGNKQFSLYISNATKRAILFLQY